MVRFWCTKLQLGPNCTCSGCVSQSLAVPRNGADFTGTERNGTEFLGINGTEPEWRNRNFYKPFQRYVTYYSRWHHPWSPFFLFLSPSVSLHPSHPPKSRSGDRSLCLSLYVPFWCALEFGGHRSLPRVCGACSAHGAQTGTACTAPPERNGTERNRTERNLHSGGERRVAKMRATRRAAATAA